MISLKTPNGFDVSVPETQDEDQIPKFNLNSENKSAIDYYNENGYVIFSNCISNETCEEIRLLWEEKKIYRSLE